MAERGSQQADSAVKYFTGIASWRSRQTPVAISKMETGIGRERTYNTEADGLGKERNKAISSSSLLSLRVHS